MKDPDRHWLETNIGELWNCAWYLFDMAALSHLRHGRTAAVSLSRH